MLRETGNLALEADPRIPPNQKKKKRAPIFAIRTLCRVFLAEEPFKSVSQSVSQAKAVELGASSGPERNTDRLEREKTCKQREKEKEGELYW